MEKLYTISDIATMTRLTERTIRNYMQMGIFDGEKIDGVWQFTIEAVEKLLESEYVQAAIRAKDNAIVFDFMANTRKKNEELCVILDIPAAKEPKEISEFFCAAVSEGGYGDIRFSFKKSGEYVRVILKGEAKSVSRMMNAYYDL